MNIRLAIHNEEHQYHNRWLQRCRELGIECVKVDAFGNDVVERLREFDGFLWRYAFHDTAEIRFAHSILTSLEIMDLTVFPDYQTRWHYDDKVAQKYLLETSNSPIVDTHVFYNINDSLDWLKEAEYPLVFKLRTGASSVNVKLLNSFSEAYKLTRKAFKKGFTSSESLLANRDAKINKIKNIKGFKNKIGKLRSGFRKLTALKKYSPRETQYVYFQKFLPGNEYDTRVVIIGNRGWAFRRMNRKNDFRASGGGNLQFDPGKIDTDLVKIAFDVSKIHRFQCMAYDFLYDQNRQPRINEISYSFVGGEVINSCPGYWDRDLNWHEGNMYAEDAILDDLVEEIKNNQL